VNALDWLACANARTVKAAACDPDAKLRTEKAAVTDAPTLTAAGGAPPTPMGMNLIGMV
jgi:transcriptional regulator GlxA family with amidase domain